MTAILDETFDRVPGLYGPLDVGLLLDEERVFLIEAGGRTEDGRQLFMVFARAASLEQDAAR